PPSQLPVRLRPPCLPVSRILPVVAIRLVVPPPPPPIPPPRSFELAVRPTALAEMLPADATVSVPASSTVALGPPLSAPITVSPVPSSRVKPLAVKLPSFATLLVVLVATVTLLLAPQLPTIVPTPRL